MTSPTAQLPAELQTLIAELAAEEDRSSAATLIATSKMFSASAAKALFAHPFLHTVAQVKGFTAALQKSPELRPLVKSLALEDRYLTHSTSLAMFPDDHDFDGPDEREEATYELCELIEDLVLSHNLSALALTVTGARNFLDIFQHAAAGRHDQKAPFSRRLPLDKLAITGSDIQSSFLYDWFRPRQSILYVCDDSLWGMGTANCISLALSDSNRKAVPEAEGPLELVFCVGNTYSKANEEAVAQALQPLFKAMPDRSEKGVPQGRVALRLRQSLASPEQVKAVVAKGQPLLGPLVEVAGWNTKEAKNQVEAEQQDLASGTWLHLGETDGAADSDQDVKLVGAVEGWSNDERDAVTAEDAEDYAISQDEQDRQAGLLEAFCAALAA